MEHKFKEIVEKLDLDQDKKAHLIELFAELNDEGKAYLFQEINNLVE